MKTIGFIDYFLDEWHANQYPTWIDQATNGAMKVAYAYGKIDAPNGLDNTRWCEERRIERLDSIEAVVEKSDYLIVLSPDHPQFHEELAEVPLRSGKPTYVDKTFAPDLKTAQRLFGAAERHGTPLYSSSALRFAAEYSSARRDGIASISSMGPGEFSNYGVHQVEPIVALMGSEARRVMFVGTEKTPAFVIGYADGRQATLQHFANSPFSLSIGYDSGEFSFLKAESDFFAAFIRNMVQFFVTREATVDPKETLTIIALIEYGLQAMRTPYQWIELPSR